MVTDDELVYCMDSWTVPVTCVDGVNPCEGVTCEDDGNECTVNECNLATGQCESSSVDDGTECDGGDGMCIDGVCEPIDLCENVVCNDDNQCTEDICDPADGSCSNNPVDDGTECDDGEGMCVGGECKPINLCEGVECPDTGNECTVGVCNMDTGECEEMNVDDGTECNDGAGACSDGVCVDDGLCDGVDCTSQNDCVQDGMCDPGNGECIPGNNEPADTPCGDGGVCDGAGVCVACNNPAQCPQPAQCNVAVCVSNLCGIEAVMDGTVCDFVSTDDGICEAGICVEAPECIEDIDCDDDNICTLDACVDGMCGYTPNVDESCELEPGLPGICNDMGECIGLCEGVDCTSSSECVQDGICDEQTGECIPGDPQPIDTICTEGGGSFCDGQGSCVECNGAEQCAAGEICEGNMCVAAPECTTDDDCNDDNQCTINTCESQMCFDSNRQAGEPCDQDGGTVCDGGGNCVPDGTCMTTEVFREDFESGIGPWFADNGVWQVGEATSGPGSCFSGFGCAATVLDGNYPANQDSRLISATTVLPTVSGNEELRMRFQSWTSIGGFGQVQVSVQEAGGTFGAWTDVGSAVSGTSGGWTIKDVELTAFAGQTVRIGFLLDVAGASFAGWYIDDIEFLIF